jgi:hypothetical protein
VNTTHSTYHLHAELLATGATSAEYDDTKAGHPLERRLNRMERVAAIYLGLVDKRSSNGLRIVFKTADAALLGACEMQHRCDVLPQVTGHRLALRIGIHRMFAGQQSTDDASTTWQIASQLAMSDDSVVASEAVVSDLSPELRQRTSPFDDFPVDMPAFKIDWRCEMPTTVYGVESVWPASHSLQPVTPYVVLRSDSRTLELTPDKTAATIGREPKSDLPVEGERVSRNHCRIEKRLDCIVLTDLSTNGTSVAPDEGDEILVKNSSVVLKGKGMLFFGRAFNGERRGGVSYEAFG